MTNGTYDDAQWQRAPDQPVLTYAYARERWRGVVQYVWLPNTKSTGANMHCWLAWVEEGAQRCGASTVHETPVAAMAWAEAAIERIAEL